MMTRVSGIIAAAVAGVMMMLAKQATATDPTRSPPTAGANTEAEYLGCFHDNKDDRLLLGDKYTSSDMTTAVSALIEGLEI